MYNPINFLNSAISTNSARVSYISVFLWDIFLHNEKDTTSFSQDDLSMFNSAFGTTHEGDVLFSQELLSSVRDRRTDRDVL